MSKKRKGKARSKSPSEKSTSTTSSGARTRAENFNPDYTYVMQDLRRIGTLAGIFITILVILSFFLR
jgi:hypothetical protein